MELSMINLNLIRDELYDRIVSKRQFDRDSLRKFLEERKISLERFDSVQDLYYNLEYSFDYYQANIVNFDSHLLLDNEFLFVLPTLLDIMVKNEGNVKAIALRLSKIEKNQFSKEILSYLSELEQILSNVDLIMHNQKKEQIITFL
jgi:hypothetical protein